MTVRRSGRVWAVIAGKGRRGKAQKELRSTGRTSTRSLRARSRSPAAEGKRPDGDVGSCGNAHRGEREQ